MSEADDTVPPIKTALVLRVQEWAAWFPMHQDPQMTRLEAISGETGLEIMEDERLVDIDIVSTQQTRHVPVPQENSKQPANVKVKLVVFRATLARTVTGLASQEVTPQEDVPDKASLIIPPEHKNRDARRKNGS